MQSMQRMRALITKCSWSMHPRTQIVQRHLGLMY